jgi:hypothetical protein
MDGLSKGYAEGRSQACSLLGHLSSVYEVTSIFLPGYGKVSRRAVKDYQAVQGTVVSCFEAF